jgi:hypothetical protein
MANADQSYVDTRLKGALFCPGAEFSTKILSDLLLEAKNSTRKISPAITSLQDF